MITSRHVIAGDGGSRSIPTLLGIALPGKHIEEPSLDIQLRAWYDLPADAPLHFTFISDPRRPGVDCPCPMGYDRVEYRFIYCSGREFAPGDHRRVTDAVVGGLHPAGNRT